jgi:hypothetical protein
VEDVPPPLPVKLTEGFEELYMLNVFDPEHAISENLFG